MARPTFNGSIADYNIPTGVKAMATPEFMSERIVMPIGFNTANGLLTVVTSNFNDTFRDYNIIVDILRRNNSEVKGLEILECTFENFASGYAEHYRQQFVPAKTQGGDSGKVQQSDQIQVTSEQTKMAQDILQKAVEAGASDIHIFPHKDHARVKYRVKGVMCPSPFPPISITDEIMICNIYKRSAGLEVTNLVNQDGRFTMFGKDFRLATTPYGDSGMRNKVVLRIIGSSDDVAKLDELGFSDDVVDVIRDLIYQPSGILLVCGPTGEGKSTTLYGCIKERADNDDCNIVTIEDPIEKYIDGVAQSQYHAAEIEKNAFTFAKAIKSFLRADPDIIMVGEIRDKETALTSVQASQTGHLIFSTLHVRNSVAVFKRLADMGVNVSGFTEQVVGIISQRLLGVGCPHCRKRVVSPLNRKLRPKDLARLEYGRDDFGNEGYITYESVGCPECDQRGISKRVAILEIIKFDNFVRDYFSKNRGLVASEKYMREKHGFVSLWDKGFEHVISGDVSLKELLSRLPVDIDFDKVGFDVAEEEDKLRSLLDVDSDSYDSEGDDGLDVMSSFGIDNSGYQSLV